MVLFLMILSIFPPSQSPFYSSVLTAADASFTGVWKGDFRVPDKRFTMSRRGVRVSRVEGCRAQWFPDEHEQGGRRKEVMMGIMNCKAGFVTGSYVCRLNDLATWTWHLNKDVLDGNSTARFT